MFNRSMAAVPLLLSIALLASCPAALAQTLRVRLPPKPIVDDFDRLSIATSQTQIRALNAAAPSILKQLSAIEDKNRRAPSIRNRVSPFTFHSRLNRPDEELLAQRRAATVLGLAALSINRGDGFAIPANSTIEGQLIACRNKQLRLERRQCLGSDRFRTIDGFCNNLRQKTWGMKNQPYIRFLSPDYADGTDSPRISKSGQPLPNARTLSVALNQDLKREEPSYTHMVMQWGQFIAHDITFKPEDLKEDNTVPACCGQDRSHSSCFQIDFPANDPLIREGQSCMEFVRSLNVPHEGCFPGHRENADQVTPLIDASTVYSDKDDTAAQLRTFRGGLLKVARTPIGSEEVCPLTPPGEITPGNCQTPPCFIAGDERANQHATMMSTHILWLREHNRVARKLAEENPQWDDEILYQEARRIVIAEIQHITYNEYLPVVLGPEFSRTFELELERGRNFFMGYDPSLRPVLSNAFAAAAYRFGHSLVQGDFQKVSGNHQQALTGANLGENYFNSIIPLNESRGSDQLFLGLANQKLPKVDLQLTREITLRLYRAFAEPNVRLDLFAINVQRGRDNGIPGYNAWRTYCGFPTAPRFEDLRDVMDQDVINKLRQHYTSVDDIDLFVAGLAEKPLFGAIMGPTFACIVAQQFKQLRKGDRFWYENGNQAGSFTQNQLVELRKTTLARVMCDNFRLVETIQPFVMKIPAFTNRRVNCGTLPQINLQQWKQNGASVRQPTRRRTPAPRGRRQPTTRARRGNIRRTRRSYPINFGG